MTLFSGLKQGLVPALLSGLNAQPGASVGAPGELVNLDFSVPVEQVLGSPNATHQYLLQNTVAGNYPDTGTGTTADINNFAAGAKEQVSVGVWDGSSYDSIKAWEALVEASNQRAWVSDASVFDSNNTKLYVRVYFRAFDTSAARTIISKRQGSNAGWDMILNNNGTLTLVIEDTTGSITGKVSSGFHGDGALHYAEFFYDTEADELTFNTDQDPGNVPLDVSVVTGSITTASFFTLGNASTAHIQVVAVEGAEGDAAATMFAETGWWTHATSPSAELDAPLRNSPVSIPVAPGRVAHFAPDTVTIGYDEAFASGLGLYCNNEIENLVPSSELSTGAVNTNITPTDLAADSPDGLRSATSLLATAANGNQSKVCTTTASTQYTATAHIEEVTAGVPGRVIMHDESNAAELGSQAFVGTGTPQSVSVVASTVVGGISTSVRVEIDNDTESAVAWGWQLEQGAGNGVGVRTSGAAASALQSDYRATGDFVNEDTGEIEAVFVIKKLPPTGELHYIFDTTVASDRRALYVNDAGEVKFLVNDSTGAEVATVTLGTSIVDTEYTARCQWDRGAGLDGDSVRAKLNALAKVSSGVAFASGGAFTSRIDVGASGATANTAHDGLIQKIRSLDGPTAMAA